MVILTTCMKTPSINTNFMQKCRSCPVSPKKKQFVVNFFSETDFPKNIHTDKKLQSAHLW